MPDILHTLELAASPSKVFDAVSTPEGLASWWALDAEGIPALAASYELDFGPGHRWSARVTGVEAPSWFELAIEAPDPDCTCPAADAAGDPSCGIRDQCINNISVLSSAC